jgi:hypothetical protein
LALPYNLLGKLDILIPEVEGGMLALCIMDATAKFKIVVKQLNVAFSTGCLKSLEPFQHVNKNQWEL